MWILMFACIGHVRSVGLVSVTGQDVSLVERDGTELRLTLEGDAVLLEALGGCQVAVDGSRRGRALRVESWEVLDAGDGSMPFVGVFRRLGVEWVLDDRTTGSRLVLEPSSVGALVGHEGEVVLVVGYLGAGSRVTVMDARVLGVVPR